MKALILAGGKGTRLRPLTNTLAKHVLPVGNKPIICFVAEQIVEAGITEIGIVVSPETGEDIRQVLGDGSKWGASITYIPQAPALGLAHAVRVSRGFLGDSPFLLFLGDNLIKERVKHLVEQYLSCGADALIVLKEVKDPRAFGVAVLDGQGRVERLVEKPKQPLSNLALVGAYIFNSSVHPLIEQLKPSWRGEYEITDAIQALVDAGKVVHSHILEGWWLDTGKKDDLLLANHRIMDEFLQPSLKGDIDALSTLNGKVEIGTGARIENSRISGPVSIAAGCWVSGSVIGPYTCLGEGTEVTGTNLENSIILENVIIRDVPRLTDCVVGRNVEILHRQMEDNGISLFLGDHARIEL